MLLNYELFILRKIFNLLSILLVVGTQMKPTFGYFFALHAGDEGV